MEINGITIKKNDYVQPTEIRNEIVQMLVDAMVELSESNDGFTIYDFELTLYICKGKKDDNLLIKTHIGKWYEMYYNFWQVRTVEMEMAFKIFIEAGYYIGVYHHSDGEHNYSFAKKPYYNNSNTNTSKFGLFID